VVQFQLASVNWTTWTYKVRDYSDWGMYGYSSGSEIPNVAEDSYEELIEKWSNWDTANHFNRNSKVTDAILEASHILGPPARPEAPWIGN